MGQDKSCLGQLFSVTFLFNKKNFTTTRGIDVQKQLKFHQFRDAQQNYGHIPEPSNMQITIASLG
jgi:hypothetical protein